MKPISLAVVGLGNIAQKAHLPALATHPGVAVVGLASRTGSQVASLATQHRFDLQARTFEEVLAVRPQAAYLLSPTPQHPDQAIALLEAGIDLFMEKPLANNLGEAEAIVEAARQQSRLLMIGFNRRYAPAYRRAKELFVASGRPVELVVLQKHRGRPDYPSDLRGWLHDDAIHMIDLARFLAGELSVQAAQVQPGLVAAQLQGRALVQLSQTYGAGAISERVELYGGGLSVVVEEMEQLTVSDNGVVRQESLFDSWTPTLTKRGIGPELDHFVHCLRTKQQPETAGAEALATQRLAEAILGSD